MSVRVQNMISNRGNAIANQFEIYADGVKYFQSYNTIIAKIEKGHKITLDTNALDYSRTTSKYLYLFLNMNKKEILADKDIKYENLNE